MIRLMIIVAIFSYQLPLQGQEDFQMPTNILRDSWRQLSAPDQASQECSFQSYALNFEVEHSEGIAIDLTCQFRCIAHDALQSEVINRSFIPAQQGMRKGDGGLWASLTTTLNYWGQEQCYHHSINQCGGLDKLVEVEKPLMNSGEWSFNSNVSCEDSQSVVLSPFEKSLKTNKHNGLASLRDQAKSAQLVSLEANWRQPFSFGRLQNENLNQLEGCQKIATATFCYGDCISLEPGKEWMEYLASPAPLGRDEYQYCIDDLWEKIKDTPANIGSYLCETHILAELKKRGATGLTCASSRLQSNCHELVANRD